MISRPISGDKFRGALSERPILSEFYHLRRTAIKDVAAYIGFLAGFIGAAPFAWELLSDQLASGSFVRGLWYFFGIVVAAGIFTGIAGLGLGYVGGVIWEQLHRQRRAANQNKKESVEQSPDSSVSTADQPRLQLVSEAIVEIPPVTGRILNSVQFHAAAISLDLGGIRLRVAGNPVTICRGQRFRIPEPGARDAICALIGERVTSVRTPTIDRLELEFESGCELVIARSAIAVA
ncbi:MAG TPA: hypothetical protein VF042_13855 [Gemmatimonadaceae bacterium]